MSIYPYTIAEVIKAFRHTLDEIREIAQYEAWPDYRLESVIGLSEDIVKILEVRDGGSGDK